METNVNVNALVLNALITNVGAIALKPRSVVRAASKRNNVVTRERDVVNAIVEIANVVPKQYTTIIPTQMVIIHQMYRNQLMWRKILSSE